MSRYKFVAGDEMTAAKLNKVIIAGSYNAGETIAGATLPVPVYQNTTDNEFYKCDANDTAKLNFVGFAISNGTNGNAMDIQMNGIVSGFSGLDEGEKYYVQDAVGTIGKTIGTYEILVGIAISATELLILKGSFEYIYTDSNSDESGNFNFTAPASARFALIKVSKEVPYGSGPDGYYSMRGDIMIAKKGKTSGYESGGGGPHSSPWYLTASWSGNTISITESSAQTNGNAVRQIDIYYYK